MHESETAGDNRSPAKLALAIGLTVVFAAVMAVQIRKYWGAAGATGSANSTGSATDRLDPDRSQLPRFIRTAAAGTEPDGKWPDVRLSACTEYDPFATPDGFTLKKEKPVQPESNSEALQAEMEITKKLASQELAISSLREAGVNAVFKGFEQNTAIVGSRMVRVGEQVQGFRVLAIEPDGIVIERPAVK